MRWVQTYLKDSIDKALPQNIENRKAQKYKPKTNKPAKNTKPRGGL